LKRLAIASLLFTALGCGPVVSGVQIVKANIALGAAETAGAKKYASSLYEYTLATEYLQKAREENGYSDFAAARDYADKALGFAVEARNKAEREQQTEQATSGTSLAPTP
jgi:hypothetical protein